MTCGDVRDVADSLKGDERPSETNHEILRHLDTCPSCRAEIDARRTVRGALRVAFDRAADLRPRAEFTVRLGRQLRDAATREQSSRTPTRRWFALAASVLCAAGLTAMLVDTGSLPPGDALARDAIGDHWNCALKYRIVRTPMPLEEAAQRFDRAFRLLVSTPPDDISTPAGPARVVDRHSCSYGARRFGHIVMQHRGRVVSLLMTTNEAPAADNDETDAIPHLIGRPVNGLSVVSVAGAHHAILLVGDLDTTELTQLSHAVSVPLVRRLAGRGAVAPLLLTARLGDRDTVFGTFSGF